MNIETLTLQTHKREELKDFYLNKLSLTLVDENSKGFSVQAGSTLLTFNEVNDGREPFYHFAFNIPENRMNEAKKWIKHRVKLNTHNEDDEVFFKSWNAHAIYFEDPAGNILEFIVRHNLHNKTEHHFSSRDIINVSEIGIVVKEVIPFARELNEIGVQNWKEDSTELTPVGDEHGLFIICREQRQWFFSTKKAQFFPVELRIEELGEITIEEKDGNVVIK
ncbi:VOC family protein [Bacillus sp. FJAT-45037]|uniref:VOC family protein n=1 Tax=Bacillus sp. FJAT-45037 TaxID=2011007 RepID=UPI000C23A0A7|nr:ring-cleaving dioxygenase [Bacillus sp. FJAT-45037]